MFTLKINSAGLDRKVGILVDELKDLKEPLRAFGAYLRAKAKRKFDAEGPGWAPVAGSTGHRLIHSTATRVGAGGKLKVGTIKKLYRQLARDVKGKKASDSAKQELTRVITANLAGDKLGKEFFGRFGSGSTLVDRLEKELVKAETATEKQKQKKLSGSKQISKHKLLGKLSSTLAADVSNRTLRVYSKVPWAGIHNKGGTGNHGADIPARPFLVLDSEDLDVLAKLIEGQLVNVFDEG